MSDADTTDLVKLQAYAARETAQTALLTGEGTQEMLDAAQSAYLNAPTPSGNKNIFVPWSNTDIPFECDCSELIYADSIHTHDKNVGDHDESTSDDYDDGSWFDPDSSMIHYPDGTSYHA